MRRQQQEEEEERPESRSSGGKRQQQQQQQQQRTGGPQQRRSSSAATTTTKILVRILLVLYVVGSLVAFRKAGTTTTGIATTTTTTTTDGGGGSIFWVPEPRTTKGDSNGRKRRQRPARSSSSRPGDGVETKKKGEKTANAKKRDHPKEDDDDPRELRLGPIRRKNHTAFPLTHYLSHIPKTGAEYAAKELGRLMVATIPLPEGRTMASIKRAQHRYSNSTSSAVGSYFDQEAVDHDHGDPDSDAYAPMLVCNQGNRPVMKLVPFHFEKTDDEELKPDAMFRCGIWVSEYPYNPRAEVTYTVVRDPIHHVVSQYHHCVESADHRRGAKGDGDRHEKMPSLSDWLKAYGKLADDTSPRENRPPYVGAWMYHDESRKLRSIYSCYNPIDSESDFVRFPPAVVHRNNEEEKGDGGRNPPRRLHLPEGYTYPYRPRSRGDDGGLVGRRHLNEPNTGRVDEGRDASDSAIDRLLFDDLRNRFGIIGDTARMIKTLCAIFVHFTEGKRVPAVCDCSGDGDVVAGGGGETGGTFKVPNLYMRRPDDDGDENENETTPRMKLPRGKWYYRTAVEIGYAPHKHSHGVKTHGHDFDLSDDLRLLVETKLRGLDLVLYNVSRDVFDAQTLELEDRYGLILCDRDWNRSSAIDD